MTATQSNNETREIDILDPRLYDDPWETYAWLRDNAPIYWDAKNEIWVISKAEDVKYVELRQEVFSSAQGVRPIIAAPMSIITMDDPEHTRERRLINRGFTPRMVAKLGEHVNELTNELISEVAQKGSIDFVEDFAIHIPLIVIAELMGLPPADRDKFFRWSDTMMAGDGTVDPEDPRLLAAAQAFGEYVTYLTELFEEKRANPSDDLISILIGAHDEGKLEVVEQGDELKHDALLMFLVILVVAGNETTRNAISGGMMAFSKFPEERAKLAADPALIDSAVEEILRYVTPVISFCRTLTEDHTYKGVEFKTGQKVLLMYQSANRDEDVFDDPDTFKIDRDPNPHLAFGIGPHFCLGANLARMEIRTVFDNLIRRLPDIAVADGHTLQRGDSTLVTAIQHLPVEFTPESQV